MNENIYTFPAIKGIQAGTEYFVSMVPLSVVPKLFSFSGNDLPAEMRSQRILNKSRIPEMKKYILDNPDSYVFSSLTVSVDGPIEFTPVNSSTDNTLGTISIPMSARLLLNDGQHRKAAIEAALQEKQSLRFETISIVFFHDLGLEKSQQMFSDLNRYAIRPTKSINVLFDSRDRLAVELCEIIEELPFFRGWVEKEKSTLANRSKALYTLSGLYHGTDALINGLNLDAKKEKETIQQFWTEVYNNTNEWQDVIKGVSHSSEIRKRSLCGHSIYLVAVSNVGNKIIKKGNEFSHYLQKLPNIDFRKNNPIWDGTIVVKNQISGTRVNINNLTNIIEKELFLSQD